MHLVQEKDAAMGLLYQAFTVTICSRVSASHNAKEMCHQQLRVPCIISTVEANKGRINGQRVKFQREGMH